ncbi:MAG: WD40 repeat domain-containing protein [Chloroflexi bacterium]|nr:WD40 repeat domain-containing protein [Chloroflexota bacterium]
MDLIAVIEAHPRHAQTVCFTRDGSRLFTGAFDPAIKVWSVPNAGEGDWSELGQMAGHAQSVNVLAESPDGLTLASGSTDRTVRLWDVASGVERAVFKGHRNTIVGLSWSPDGRRVASCSYDGTVRIWSAEGGEPIVCRGHERHAFAVAYTSESGPLISGGMDGFLHLWDSADGGESDRIAGPGGVVSSLAWDDGRSTLWALGTEGGIVRYVGGDWSSEPVAETTGIGLHAMNLSPDGTRMAVTADHAVYLYDAVSGARLERMEVPIKGVYGSAWSPDGSLLAVAGADGRARVWNISG